MSPSVRAALAGGMLAVAAAVASAADAPPGPVVNCFDPVRDLVLRTSPERCRGEIVGDAEAERIRSGRDAYVARSVAPPQPAGPGGRATRVGSAFFVSRGILLTNAHVVRDCRRVTIEAAIGRDGDASILHMNAQEDLALLETAVAATPVTFSAARAVADGEPVTVIGYPGRPLPPLVPDVAVGRVQGTLTLPQGSRRYAIAVEVRSGSSGGPVLDESRRVIGVISAKVDQTVVYRRTGRVFEDTGIAVPIETVLRFLRSGGVDPVGPPAGHEAGAPNGFMARVLCWG